MFVLLTIDIGNERWTKSGFLTRLSNGGPPQVPGTHAGTRGVGEFDGIIAAVYEDEIYYHRDQCDMITMILRLAAEPAWRYERGRQTTHTAGAAGEPGGRVVEFVTSPPGRRISGREVVRWNGRSTLVPIPVFTKLSGDSQKTILAVESKPPNGQNGDQDAG